MRMKTFVQAFFHRLAKAASPPWETEEERFRKVVLILMVAAYTVLSFVWGSIYLLLGVHYAYFIPYGYGAVSILTLFLLYYAGSYRFFRSCQLWLILLVPFLLQWRLGGFQASGAVMIWSILSPVGALMFSGIRRAWPWFVGYILMVMASGFVQPDAGAAATAVSTTVCACFFVFNIGGVTSIAFFLLKYFVAKSEATIALLGEANVQVRREKERIDKIKRMMAYFVPQTAQRMIEDSPDQALLNKYIRDASVLFLDIEGFSAMTKQHPYERINRTIEHYFSLFFDLIRQRDGDINETAGDGMMVIFLGENGQMHAENAVLAAIEMLKVCSAEAEKVDPDLLPIRVNVGINSGEVYLGSTKIHSRESDRWTFTASGGVTVLAARLSDYAQGGKILIGEETAARVKKRFRIKPLQGVALKNLEDFGPVYEVLAETGKGETSSAERRDVA